MDALMVYGMMWMEAIKERMTELARKEKGGSEIIATIILVVIVVLLGVLFKDKIMEVANNLFKTIDQKVTNNFNN